MLYPNAFAGVKADVRYTYRKGAFEQDVILREQPPAPESLGLNSKSTEIEVLTEFIAPPPASVVADTAQTNALPDEEIGWGVAGHCGSLAPLPGTDCRPPKPETKCVNHFSENMVSQLTRSHKASQPIQVGQFANGEEFDNPYPTYAGRGDPCEILLPPVGHYLETNIVFIPFYDTNSTGDFDENYLNLIVAQSATNNTFVDTFPVAATNFVAIGTSGYYGTRLSVTNGVHKVTSSQPVGVEDYGFGLQDAYGCFSGVVK